MENNKKYWDNFYKEGKQPIQSPSPFAKWFVNSNLGYCSDHAKIVDLGAGCGRDTEYLAEYKGSAIGIDKNIEVVDLVYQEDFNKLDLKIYNTIYSRFFLHSISNKEISELLKKIKKNSFFVAEFRVKGDEPVIYKNHKRNLIDMTWLLIELDKNNYSINYCKVGRGLAKFKQEDPLVGRIVAYKSKK